MDSNHHVILVAAVDDTSATIAAYHNRFSSAAVTRPGAGNNIAVCSGGETSLKSLVHVPCIVVESNEGLVAAAESNLVAAVVPPVSKGTVTSGVPEDNHVVDLTPTVLAYPTIAASIISVDSRRGDITPAVHWRSSFGIREGETTHQLRVAIRMCQHESDSALVLSGLLVCQNVSTSAMTSLVVVVVNESQSVSRSEKAPLWTPVNQPSKLVSSLESLTEFQSKSELSNGSKWSVFVATDSFTTEVDDFLVDVGTSTGWETVGGI